jgi:hypothetical protein
VEGSIGLETDEDAMNTGGRSPSDLGENPNDKANKFISHEEAETSQSLGRIEAGFESWVTDHNKFIWV